MPKGLYIAAITKGVNTSDSLVFREGESLDTLKSKSVIATSSIKREQAVALVREDLLFKDIRGTIDKRLKILDAYGCDGVVIAEAALIRLQLTHRSRISLPGKTTPLQGKLAIVCHQSDLIMKKIFSKIDVRCQKLCI